MNSHQLHIITEAKKLVSEMFARHANPLLVFHDLAHTQQVVVALEEIMSHYHITDENRFILTIAAWFHDVGFCAGTPSEHEQKSIQLVTKFLRTQGIQQRIIKMVSSCIQATKMPQHPVGMLEKMICDADLFHLGTELFIDRTEKLRKELENYQHRKISPEEWRAENIMFLSAHTYFTVYCQQKLVAMKQTWIKRLQEQNCNEENS